MFAVPPAHGTTLGQVATAAAPYLVCNAILVAPPIRSAQLVIGCEDINNTRQGVNSVGAVNVEARHNRMIMR
jgi:hypothetical protein